MLQLSPISSLNGDIVSAWDEVPQCYLYIRKPCPFEFNNHDR